MKVAKIKPCGMSSSFGLKAGVQRNTKVYIEPSNRDCIAPSNTIFSSEEKVILSEKASNRVMYKNNQVVMKLRMRKEEEEESKVVK